MRHRLVPSLLLAAAMAACRAPAGTDPKPAKSALPSTPATATPAKPTGAAFLKPLPGKAAKLAGQVYVDALYATTAGGATRLQDAAGGVLGAGGAQFIGNAGGTAVAQGGNGLITNDGGSLMAGGQIVAQGGGNVIVPAGLITNDGGSLITNDGGSLITNDGGSLITNDGGSLITNDGGSLITNDGAGIVAQGGGNLARPGGYQLAEAPAGAAPAFGDAWPAAGMWLSVVDQRTGLTVPLGQDAQGKNVYTVYTNAEGKYDVSVDAQVEPYARVVVRAPGRVDRRMVVSGVSASGRVDDDTRAVDAFMRLSIGRLVLGALGVDTGDGLVFASSTSDSELDVVAQLALADLRQKVKDLNIAAYSQAKKLEFGLLLADALLVAVDYRHLTLDGEGVTFISAGGRAAVGKPVQDAVVDLMRQTRLATAAQLKGQADPAAFFGAKKYVIEANLRRKPAEQYQIRRAADIPEFIVREYISVPLEGQSSKAFDVLYDLGLPNDARDILAMAGHTVFGKALKKLVAVAPDGTTLNDGLVKLANLADKRLGKAVLPVPVPDGAPPALPTAPPPAPM
ncbi:MAG: hypothetical protein JWM80_5393, partial [Cyanobacteria bacterium RYN_339]|nr:hypothetical protein [Cyanobacteria bacterium RYN_339]